MEANAVKAVAVWLSRLPGDGEGGSVDGLKGTLPFGGVAAYADEDGRYQAEVPVEDAPGAHVDDGRETGSWLERSAVIVSVLKGHGGGDVVVAVVVKN